MPSRIGGVTQVPTSELFGEAFRDLASASRALAAYPPAHPVVTKSLAAAHAALGRLLEVTGPLELAVTRGGFLHGSERFDSQAPERLAEQLRRRGVAVLRIDPGATPEEIGRFLTLAGAGRRRARQAGSLADELAAAGLVHLAVRDLDFSTLVLVEGELERDEEEGAGDDGSIWEELVRRLVEGGAVPSESLAAWLAGGGSAAGLVRSLLGVEGGGGEGEGSGRDPAARAEIVQGAFRAVVSAYAASPSSRELSTLTALASVVSAGEREVLAQELSRAMAGRAGGERALAAFFSTFPEEEEDRLRQSVESATRAAGAASAERTARLRRAFGAADVDALDDRRGGTRGKAAGELLLELAAPARATAPSPHAPAIRDELAGILVQRTTPPLLLELAEQLDLAPAARSVVFHRFEAVYRALLGSGRLAQAEELVERVQKRAAAEDDTAQALRRLLERLTSRESLDQLASVVTELSDSGLAQARRFVERLGPTAARHLLGALSLSEDRAQRHRLLELLSQLGPLVVRDATRLLSDPRWYVVRNVLLLLRQVGDPGSVPAVRRCAEHPDLRVKLEAIRNLFAFDQSLPRELLRRALTDADPRLAAEAIDLAAEGKMAEAAEPLAEMLATTDLFGRRRAVRLKAIRALAEIGDPSVLPRLKRYAARVTFLPVAVEERAEFFRSLGAYPEEARAEWIERGRKLRRPEVDEALRALAAPVRPQRAEEEMP